MRLNIDANGNVLSSPTKSGSVESQLVIKLIKEEIVENNYENAAFWKKECKIAKRLLASENSPEFWDYFELEYKLNSLAFLISERGRSILKDSISNWKLTKSSVLDTIDEDYELELRQSKIEPKAAKLDVFNF